MKPKIKPEAWSYIDQFFQEMPEAMTKLPTIQQAFQQAVQYTSVNTQKRVLIRQLRRKFASVSKKVVQKIEATNDLEQLDNWLDQVIVADSLAQTELGATTR